MSKIVWEIDALRINAAPIYDLDLRKDIRTFVWDNGITQIKGDRIILPPTKIKDDQERAAIKAAMVASVEPLTGTKTYIHTYYVDINGTPICNVTLGKDGKSTEYFTIFVSNERE